VHLERTFAIRGDHVLFADAGPGAPAVPTNVRDIQAVNVVVEVMLAIRLLYVEKVL
jgi:hypothetical protein